MKTEFLHDKDFTDVLYTENVTDCNFGKAFDDAVRFIMKSQLLRVDLWKKFVNLYRLQPDAKLGWSGEYWGKMMRGATWVYAYNRDKELYGVLRDSVLDIISTAEPNGRISTYAMPFEFCGWDMWCRKYVLMGLECFYEICPEKDLKTNILDAMMQHTDYIIQRVGGKIGRIPITKTSDAWLGMSACSILEPVMNLWKLTGKKAYFDFAEYIVNCGGSGADESIFECAYRDERPPFCYPLTKAYEMMSCFEGLAEYYRATRIEKWRTAILNFAHRIVTVEKSVIGCCGCYEEQFDGAAIRQTATSHYWIMHETCVTVTWMKLCLQALRISGNPIYADCIEESYFNAYLGALNTHENKSLSRVQSDVLNPMKSTNLPMPEILTFDSYSPLVSDERGKMVGGYNVMPDNTFYGCCACIGSAGVGMIPKSAVMHSANGPVINLYFEGYVNLPTPKKQNLKIATETGYPYRDGIVKMALALEKTETFTLTLRVPAWSGQTSLTVNDKDIALDGCGYQSVTREWKNGDTVVLNLDMRIQAVEPPVGSCNEADFRAYRMGPVMLGADARLEKDPASAFEIVCDKENIVNDVQFTEYREIPDAKVCVELPTVDGKNIRLIDYSSAGKTWDNRSTCAVWLQNGRSDLKIEAIR